MGATAVRNIPVGNAIARHFERIRVIGYHIHRLAQVDFFSIGGIKKLRSRTFGRQRIIIRNCSTTGRYCYKHTTGNCCTSGVVLDFCLKQATRNTCRYSFIAGIAIRHIFLKYAASDCSMIDYTPMSTCKSAAYNSTTVAHIRKGSARNFTVCFIPDRTLKRTARHNCIFQNHDIAFYRVLLSKIPCTTH